MTAAFGFALLSTIDYYGRYPNGDPEQSGEFLRGESADMGGGDYIKGWVRHSRQA